MTIMMTMMIVALLESLNHDDDGEEDDDYDIYIMMQCLFVCHEKWALS